MNEVERCAYCRAPLPPPEVITERASIHRDGLGEGPEVALCVGCASENGPSCEEIWERIAKPAAGTFAHRPVCGYEDPDLGLVCELSKGHLGQHRASMRRSDGAGPEGVSVGFGVTPSRPTPPPPVAPPPDSPDALIYSLGPDGARPYRSVADFLRVADGVAARHLESARVAKQRLMADQDRAAVHMLSAPAAWTVWSPISVCHRGDRREAWTTAVRQAGLIALIEVVFWLAAWWWATT